MKWSVSAKELKTVADTLKDVLTQCWFIFDVKEISMLNVDPEKIARIVLRIQPDTTRYSLNSQAIIFTTYMQTIYKVMRGSKVKDTAMITIDENDTSKMIIEIFEGDGTRKNLIHLVSMTNEYPRFSIPTLPYKSSLIINTSVLYHMLHDLSVVSREFTFEFSTGYLRLCAQDDCGTVKSHWTKFDGIEGSHKGKYLIKYAEKFCKPRLAKFVEIQFGKGFPLTFTFKIEDGYLEMSIAELE